VTSFVHPQSFYSLCHSIGTSSPLSSRFAPYFRTPPPPPPPTIVADFTLTGGLYHLFKSIFLRCLAPKTPSASKVAYRAPLFLRTSNKRRPASSEIGTCFSLYPSCKVARSSLPHLYFSPDPTISPNALFLTSIREKQFSPPCNLRLNKLISVFLLYSR